MATNAAAPNKGTDGLVPTYQDLGVDAEGYHHALDRRRDVIHRVDPATGQRERVTDRRLDAHAAPGNATEAYIQHVAADVGWAERVPTATDLFDGTRHCPQHDRQLVQDATGCLHCPGCQR
jgi:hypothetical protein